MTRRSYRSVFLTWLVLATVRVLGEPAQSQPRLASEPEYGVTKWTAEGGLPQNSVKALVQTGDGYLWVGTLNGLARFDGARFKVFDHRNTPEMTHDSIDALAENPKTGELWIGTRQGLLCYRPHGFRHFGPRDGVPDAVGVLAPASQGGVWFSQHPGQLGLAREERIQLWDFAPYQYTNLVRQIIEESPSLLILLLNTPGSNIFRLNLNRNSLEPMNTPAAGFTANSLVIDPQGTSWLCAVNGLWRGDKTNWMRLAPAQPPLLPWPRRAYPASGGHVWVLEDEVGGSSLRRVVDGALQPLVVEGLPSDLNFTHLLEDREGALWVGTPLGLLHLQRKQARVYSRRDGLSSDDTAAVTEAPDGTIFVGTKAAVTTIRAGAIANWTPQSWIFVADHLSRLWAAAGPDLMLFSGDRSQVVPTPAYLPALGGIRSLYEDSQQRIWIGSKQAVFYQNGKEWACLSITNGFSAEDVRVIHQDRRGDLWFGAFGGGLTRLHDGQFTTCKTARGKHNNRAWSIHEDADGILWIGSEDGLNRFVPPSLQERSGARTSRPPTPDADPFYTFTTRQGLQENTVNNVQEDDFGCLWLSGLSGIYRVSRKELNEVAAGKRSQVRCLALGEADGLLSSECNGGDNQPAGCRDHQGGIWFPTAKGVAVIDPKLIHQNDVAPPVVIEQVRANDEVIFGDDCRKTSEVASSASDASPANPHGVALDTRPPVLRLGPGRARVLEIHYTANTLAAPGRVRFKYQLQGYDSDWRSDDDNGRVAYYTNLRPRSYTFQVIACNNHGLWNEQGAVLAFFLEPHFYETTAFYTVCALLLLSAALAIHHYRIVGLNRLRRLEQQHALDLERARIARDIHDDLGSRFLRISVLGELSERNLPNPAQCRPCLEKLRATTSEAFQALDEIVWAANPKQDSVAGLVSYLREYVPQFLSPAGIQCRLDFPSPVPDLPLGTEVRHHLFLAVKEALQNVAKHAQATEVSVRLELENGTLVLEVKDNGRGFDPGQATLNVPPSALGNGLDNMRERMAQTGGRFAVRSAPGQGTEITLRVPL